MWPAVGPAAITMPGGEVEVLRVVASTPVAVSKISGRQRRPSSRLTVRRQRLQRYTHQLSSRPGASVEARRTLGGLGKDPADLRFSLERLVDAP